MTIGENKTQPKASPADIREIYEDWLVARAKSVFKHKVDEYSRKVGSKYKALL